MTTVNSEDIKVGMFIKTWFGTHRIVELIPYTTPFDFTLNIMTFEDGSQMTNCKNQIWTLV